MADRAGSWPDDGPIGIILATYFLVVNMAGLLEDLLSSLLAHPVVGLINLTQVHQNLRNWADWRVLRWPRTHVKELKTGEIAM